MAERVSLLPTPGHHRNVDRIDDGGHQGDVFVLGEGRCLTGGTGHDETVVATFGGEMRREGLGTVEIERPVGVERCHHGGEDPPESCFHTVNGATSGLRFPPPFAFL